MEDDFERRNREKRDFNNDRNRGRDLFDRGRRDYSNGMGIKRMASNRREDDFTGSGAAPTAKRNRFDSACDSFEPQFIHRDLDGQNILLTFRRFLATLDDSAVGSEEEAISKYLDYKIDFKKRECNKYFQEHKEEEWFRLKYHPEESQLHKEAHRAQVRKRLDAFNEFCENGRIEKVSLDFINAVELIRLLDAVVIKLEGGSDEAIANLELEELEDESVAEAAKLKTALNDALKKKDDTTSAEPTNGTTTTATTTTNAGDASGEPADSTNTSATNADATMAAAGENGDAAAKKEPATSSQNAADENANVNNIIINNNGNTKRKTLHKTCSIHFKSIPANAKLDEVENICKQHPGFLRVGLTDPLPEAKLSRHGWVTYRRDVNIKEIFWSLRNAKLAGKDLGAVVNRDLKRRVRPVSGVTLQRSVTQNDIRHAAKLIALYDHRAGLFVENDDVPQAPLENLEQAILVSKNPLLSGAVDYLVEEASAEEESYLYGTGGGGGDRTLAGVSTTSTATPTANAAEGGGGDAKVPLEVDASLLAILDKYLLYLRIVHSVDYYNCAEYANEDNMPNRLGLIHTRGPSPTKNDAYAKSSPDGASVLLSKKYVDDYVDMVNQRIASTLLNVETIAEDELVKLGKRDAEKAVEEFIQQNCVELAKDKWLCPLSGKKFKGPEFIQKHLQSKHAEKLAEVRNEVLFFNNFLEDPMRPRNPQPPKPAPSAADAPAEGDMERLTQQPLFDRVAMAGNVGGGGGGPFRSWAPRYGAGGNVGGRGVYSTAGAVGVSGGGFNRSSRYLDPMGGATGGPPQPVGIDAGGMRRDPRQQIAYRDLDAPEEIF